MSPTILTNRSTPSGRRISRPGAGRADIFGAVILAARLRVPDPTRALLWDLDGVMLDTLSLEYEVVNDLLRAHGIDRTVERETVREAFPYPIPDAWRRMLGAIGQPPDEATVLELSAALERERAQRRLAVHEGVPELLAAARESGLTIAVVSNNPAAHVEEMLADAGLRENVDAVVGNDGEGVRSKPAPDPYLAGAKAARVEPACCVAIEDSLLGARSGRQAGCHVIGVATGAATFAELSGSPEVDAAHERFARPVVRFGPGDVSNKTLDTPNEFVSHMLEHVAWRLGCEVELRWHCDDWDWLGREAGAAIAPLLDGPDSAEALGMIDDGSAEVRVGRGAGVELTGAGVDVDWFTGLRVEQLDDGRPLLALLGGLAEGAGVHVQVAVTSLEDPHHTWEAIWRGVGMALRGMSRTLGRPAEREPGPPAGGLELIESGPEAARVRRSTAESVCDVLLTLEDSDFAFGIETSHAVRSEGLADLVELLAASAGMGARIDFSALRLSSSHVAAEDVGMTIGAALKVLATERMAASGIEGAGSSLNGQPRPIRVGISFEGRKFVRFAPVGWSYDELRRTLIGQTLSNGLFSEDLDDFVDGLAGGMGCSIVVHWERVDDPDETWRLIFEGLGSAIAELLRANPARRGVIAGVKGTLA
jgi:HAD superfamily hydrolase (TIGR01509 family)